MIQQFVDVNSFQSPTSNSPTGYVIGAVSSEVIDDFINNFNKHHGQNFYLSDEICINESMS